MTEDVTACKEQQSRHSTLFRVILFVLYTLWRHLWSIVVALKQELYKCCNKVQYIVSEKKLTYMYPFVKLSALVSYLPTPQFVVLSTIGQSVLNTLILVDNLRVQQAEPPSIHQVEMVLYRKKKNHLPLLKF